GPRGREPHPATIWGGRRASAGNRRTVMTARFLAVQGRLQRAGLVVHVVAERFIDLSAELNRLRDGNLLAPNEPSLPTAQGDLFFPKSRDFPSPARGRDVRSREPP